MTIIDDIKSRIDLVDFVGDKVTLKKSGNSFTGFCPFHTNTKTPSFAVFPHTQTWKCFGTCNEGGDIFDYVMKEQGLNFVEAMRLLADKANISLDNSPEAVAHRQRQADEREIYAMVANYYVIAMHNSPEALAYWQGRGFDEKMIASFSLGYSDGKLTEHLTRLGAIPLALQLGLLGKDEETGRVYDAIPKRFMVYIIHDKIGRVLGFEGRALDPDREPQHKRLGDKQICHLRPNRNHDVLVVTEGRADGLTWAQWGFHSMSLGGLNTAGLDKAELKPYKTIYYVPDQDEPGQKNIDKIAPFFCPLTRIVKLTDIWFWLTKKQPKDSNDLLKMGLTSEQAKGMLTEAKPYLNFLIERTTLEQGEAKDEMLKDIFILLKGLDKMPFMRYKKLVMKSFDMSLTEFNEYFKDDGEVKEEEVDLRSDKQMYRVIQGCMVFMNDGAYKLVEAVIKIERLIVRTDGGENVTKFFELACTRSSGVKLQPAYVEVEQFDSLKWIRQNWPFVALNAARGVREHLVAAITIMSDGNYSEKTIYERMGWAKIGGEWVYLSKVPLGMTEISDVEIDLKLGRDSTTMERYNLPVEPQQVKEAIRASLGLWEMGLGDDMLMMTAMAYIAPMKPLLNPSFTLVIVARTTSFKSTKGALAMCHFGDWTGRDGWKFLPCSFKRTPFSTLKNASVAQDSLMVIDDYYPRETRKETDEQLETASNIIRLAGNNDGRERLANGRRFQATTDKVRCLSIILAEEVPGVNQSALARIISVKARSWSNETEDSPELVKFKEKLTEAQEQTAPLLPHAMSAFIYYLKENWEDIKEDLAEQVKEHTHYFNKSSYARQPEAFAQLMTAIDVWLAFAVETGAINLNESASYRDMAKKTLLRVMLKHNEIISGGDPVIIFVDLLKENLGRSDWYVAKNMTLYNDNATADKNYTVKSSYEDVPHGVKLVGFINQAQEEFCLYPIYARAIFEGDYEGKKFPLSKRNELYARLREGGVLKEIAVRWIAGKSTAEHVMVFDLKAIYPELCPKKEANQ